jgi:hypothetical protein
MARGMTGRLRLARTGAAAIGCAVAACGMGALYAGVLADRESYVAQMDRADAEYRAARERCDDLAGNPRRVCVAEARAARRIAHSEIALQQKDTPKSRYDARVARAEAGFEVAKERCGELAGHAREMCIAEARADEARAKNAARLDRQDSETRDRLRSVTDERTPR